MTWKDVYAPNMWGNEFGKKGPGYDPVIGHRGVDVKLGGHKVLPAWERLTVVNSDQRSGALGNCITLRADDGAYIGIAHALVGSRPNNGAIIQPGQQLLKIATFGDFTGTAWTGPHAHIVLSDSPSAALGFGRLRDAKPRILAALNSDGFEPASALPGAPMWPVGQQMERLQYALEAKGRYAGKKDGRGGTLTATGVQITLNFSQCNGVKPYVRTAEDGVLGKNNAYGVQHYGKRFGGYGGPLDGKPLFQSWDAFIRGLEAP